MDETRPVGRPPIYDPQRHPKQAYELALLGFTNKRMAEFWQIDEVTFYEWQREHEEFAQAVTRGKEPADAQVAVGLFKRGAGYEYESEKIVTVSLGDGMGSEVQRVPITVHVPPDPGAALNWLKNRQPDLWRDKKDLIDPFDENDVDYVPVVRIRSSTKPKEEDKDDGGDVQ